MSQVDYDYIVIRHVPSVCREQFRNIGVVLHAPTAGYLASMFDDRLLAPRVSRYVENLRAIVSGDEDGGPIAALSRSERFHWLSAPRSDCLQPSAPHGGRARRTELDDVLRMLFEHSVTTADES